jgi:hypothetical protein
LTVCQRLPNHDDDDGGDADDADASVEVDSFVVDLVGEDAPDTAEEGRGQSKRCVGEQRVKLGPSQKSQSQSHILYTTFTFVAFAFDIQQHNSAAKEKTPKRVSSFDPPFGQHCWTTLQLA